MTFDEFMVRAYAAMAILVALVLVWFVCVFCQLSVCQLRERHPEKYREMGFADLLPHNLGEWFRGYSNAVPVGALLRKNNACTAGKTRYCSMPPQFPASPRSCDGSSACTFALFVLFVAAFFYWGSAVQPSNRSVQDSNAADSPRTDPRRERAFELHRATHWTQNRRRL